MTHKLKLLIVEDDPNLGQILKEYLEVKGFDPHLCSDGESGLDAFKKNNFDFCILDIMLPKKDGFELAKEIRASDRHIPLIFLTAKSMREDTIEGLKIGADDYVKKPFSMEELIARIENLLQISRNSGSGGNQESIYFGRFEFRPETYELIESNGLVQLSHRESKILEWLCRHMNGTCHRKDILMNLWGDDSYFNSRNLDVYINKLRKYLKSDESVQIVTLKGVGYLFRVDR